MIPLSSDAIQRHIFFATAEKFFTRDCGATSLLDLRFFFDTSSTSVRNWVVAVISERECVLREKKCRCREGRCECAEKECRKKCKDGTFVGTSKKKARVLCRNVDVRACAAFTATDKRGSARGRGG